LLYFLVRKEKSMRLKYSFSAIFMAAMLILASYSIAQDIENLLSNPDFKMDTNGWTIGNGNTLAIDFDEECPTGTNVMKATIDNVGANSWEPEIHSPSFALANGRTYTYSFWAKTEPEETREVNTSFESNDPEWAGAGSITIFLTDEWQEFHSTAPWSNEDRPTVVIHIALNYPPTELLDVWFARAKVYEGDYVEEEIEEIEPKAVNPADKLTTAWGRIKKL
jgi:hypothetical protein